jgi:hypothetical protein
MRKNLIKASLLIVFSAWLGACGGGGGGGGEGFVGAATVSIRLQPSTIDSGDRTQVSILIGDVHENGIALKVRFPDGLRYVPASAFLTANDRRIDLTPTVNAASTEDDSVYVVFYLSQSLFRTSGSEYFGEVGEMRLQLEGRKAVSDGKVEVDADVDDPQESNDSEFSLTNPEFAAEDRVFISVKDG